MPDVNILIKARDEASSVIGKVAGELGSWTGSVSRIAASAGAIGAVASAAAAAGAAIVAVTAKFADEVESMSRVASNARTGAANVQVAREAFERMGLGADAADSALQQLGVALRKNDPDLRKVVGNTSDAYEALLRLSDASQDQGRTAEVARAASAGLGKAYKEMSGSLAGFRSEADKTRGILSTTGGLMNADMLDSATNLDTALDDLKTTWKGLWTSWVAVLAPAVTAALSLLTKLAQAIGWFLNLKPIKIALKFAFETSALGAISRWLGRGKPGEAGPAAPAGGGVDEPEDRSARTKSAREKRIESLIVTLGVGRKRAEELATALDKAEGDEKRRKLIDDLAKAGADVSQFVQPLTFEDVSKMLPSNAPAGPGLRGQAIPKLTIHDLVDVPSLKFDPFVEVVTNWREAVAEMMSAAAVLDDMLQALQSSLAAGFSGIFSAVVLQTTSVADAVRNAFRSLIESILQELGKLLAIKLISALIGGGGGGLAGSVKNAARVRGSMSVGAGLAGGNGALGGLRAGGVTNVYITAWDARGAVQQALAPRGALRAAAVRVATLGEF